MRRIIIFAAAALFAFYSCKKETIKKSPANLQTFSTHTIFANGLLTEPFGADLAGFHLLDLCSNEICTAISGTVVFYIASDGSLKPLVVYNFVFRGRYAIIYRGKYDVYLEPFTLFGESNTYKLIFKPRGVSTNNVILALLKVKTKENGLITIQIDSGTIECH